MNFGEVFTALGVPVQLASCLDGHLTICNIAKRVKELVETIKSITSAGALSKAQALRLRGRMQFAEGQLFGRVGLMPPRSVRSRPLGDRRNNISSLQSGPDKLRGYARVCGALYSQSWLGVAVVCFHRCVVHRLAMRGGGNHPQCLWRSCVRVLRVDPPKSPGCFRGNCS